MGYYSYNMKKFVFIALATMSMVTCSLTADAQLATCPTTVAGDTVVNTATVNKQITTSGSYQAAGVQITLTKISGTVAGTTKLQGSINGTAWEDIGSAFTHTDVASQSKLFAVTGGVPYVYLRTTSVGSGTMSAKVSICYVLKPKY
jgi:hypothetical protein